MDYLLPPCKVGIKWSNWKEAMNQPLTKPIKNHKQGPKNMKLKISLMLVKKILDRDVVGNHLSPMNQKKRKEDSVDLHLNSHYLLNNFSPIVF